MSIPTFDSTALVSRAARDLPGAPEVRLRAETLPGVNGQYVQPHGSGGRKITVSGVLTATGASAAAAHQSLKAALRTRQALADGATVATYVGTDGSSYSNCMLTAYQADGDVQVSPRESACEAIIFIKAEVLQLTP